MELRGVSEEQVFAALDEQPVGLGTTRWWARVIGVHIDGRDVWVQLARDTPDSDETVILHLPSDTTVDDALVTLRKDDPWRSGSRVWRVVPSPRTHS